MWHVRLFVRVFKLVCVHLLQFTSFFTWSCGQKYNLIIVNRDSTFEMFLTRYACFIRILYISIFLAALISSWQPLWKTHQHTDWRGLSRAAPDEPWIVPSGSWLIPQQMFLLGFRTGKPPVARAPFRLKTLHSFPNVPAAAETQHMPYVVTRDRFPFLETHEGEGLLLFL